MPNKFYSFPKSVFEYYHGKLKSWVMYVLPTKVSDLDNDSNFVTEIDLGGIVAAIFSTSSTYTVNSFVIYDKKLWRCTTAVSSAGAWTGTTNWTQVLSTQIFTGSAPGLVPAAESGDADKVLKGDGTWGEAGSSVRVSYDAQNEELHMDFSPVSQQSENNQSENSENT